MMLPSKLDDVTLTELQQLVDDGVRESKVIEFKKGFYVLKHPDKEERRKQNEELLKDISCLANTIGGDLIIGIGSKDGVAVDLCGFDHPNPDGLMLQITEILQQHLEPRISVSMRPIEHSPGRIVLVIRVAQSAVGPHRVIFQKEPGQFWARSDANAYRMDTSELRRAFTSSKTLKDEITRFQHDRLNAIREGRTSVKLPDVPKVVCQIIPLESFASQVDYTMQAMEAHVVNLQLLHYTGGWSPKYTEGGLVTTDGLAHLPPTGYVQLFRNGVIESVSACEVTYTFPGYPQNHFFATYYIQALIQKLPKYISVLRSLGTAPPVFIFMTLTGMQGVRIHVEHAVGTPFDRDVILMPVVELTSLEVDDFAPVLRSAFDHLWNTAGHNRCHRYSLKGSFQYK